MANRETLVTTVAFIAAILGFAALLARWGAAAARYLLMKLYHAIFRQHDSKIINK